MIKYFLFLDYDGTLTPIVKKPSLAVLSQPHRLILKGTAKSPHIIVGIISGRQLSDLKKKVRIPGLVYAGNHGFEIQGPGINTTHPEALKTKPVLKEIKRLLQKNLKHIKGIIIEDKTLSLSIHYRMVKNKDFSTLRKIFNDTTRPFVYHHKIKLTQGKKVFEIRPPVKWDKGKAVLWLLKKLSKGKKDVPIYIGDDKTDEDAFLALRKKGITIRVGRSNNTYANRCIDNVNGVYKFIKSMLKSGPGAKLHGSK